MISKKIELIAFSKCDLNLKESKKFSKMFQKKIGKKPYIFSSISKDGIENLVKALFKECINND